MNDFEDFFALLLTVIIYISTIGVAILLTCALFVMLAFPFIGIYEFTTGKSSGFFESNYENKPSYRIINGYIYDLKKDKK